MPAPSVYSGLNGDNHAMLMTCIGGPLHGLQVGLPDDAQVYEMEGIKPRARYLRLGPLQHYDPGAGHPGSVAFFALSSLGRMELTDLIIAHLEAFRARRDRAAESTSQQHPARTPP